MSHQPVDFAFRIKQFNNSAIKLTKQANLYSWLRVVTFIITALTAFILISNDYFAFGLLLIVAGGLIFAFFIKKYNGFIFQKNQSLFLKNINQEAINRLDLNFKGLETNEEAIDENHFYSADLDLFGNHSVWQLIWHGNTSDGRGTLSQWLKNLANPQEILARQEAVKTLKNNIDWLQSFEALGKHDKTDRQKDQAFIKWLNKPFAPIPSYLKWVTYFLGAVNLSMIFVVIFTDLPWYAIFPSITISYGFMFTNTKRINEEMGGINRGENFLKQYSRLIAHIEIADFKSEWFEKQRAKLFDSDINSTGPYKETNKKASQRINELSKILNAIDGRVNMIYIVINSFLLLENHTMIRLDRWRNENKSDISKWFEALGNIEAISSLASFSINFPHFTLPNVKTTKSESDKPNTSDDEQYHIASKQLGHPLIHSDKRVANDFKMEKKGTLYLITGSNMSGKSTFLRTVGVNLILASIGAPVCASDFSFVPIQLFTSMRTKDKLEESVSSFYAELQRIQSLIEETKTGKPVLYMLDEILKGTNSMDRHRGAKGLMKQLMQANAMGFISTHDLDLGKVSEEAGLEGLIKNYSFNSTINGDNISFDYTLTEGVCHTFNASVLMKNIGIIM